jgi:4-hydroxythreonine-4-phosphate dehydrogenase
MGDINGIGPEILVKALARPEAHALADLVVVGAKPVYEAVMPIAPGAPSPLLLSTLAEFPKTPGVIGICDFGHAAPAHRPGVLDPAAGASAIEWVKETVARCIDGTLDGIVTGPISKTAVYQAGYHYIGHTELVAELTHTAEFRMCLFAGGMRVVHITGHLSLRDALDAVTEDRIAASVRIANDALCRMGIARPRIAVMGLNPHAGEDGAFGTEDRDIIAPAVRRCVTEGYACDGPHPPDTLLGKMRDGLYDVVIAMYHDQGHIPMKLIAMDEGVNVTLGIPMVRTSVDHGTAFDIAGKGIAREDSLIAAITLAAQLARPAQTLSEGVSS